MRPMDAKRAGRPPVSSPQEVAVAERRQRRMAVGLALAGLVLSACSSTVTSTAEPNLDQTPTTSAADATSPADRTPREPEGRATRPGVDARAVAALDFTARRVGGGTVSGIDAAGDAVVLWMWAPWCPACNREAPHVAEVAASLGNGVTVIGVAGHDQDSAHEAFVADHGLEHVVHAIDEDGSLWGRYGVNYQPAWVFIAPDGTTRVHAGGLYANLADWIAAQIDE
jgi:thiol-disulfide isomerase/thioredoxin